MSLVQGKWKVVIKFRMKDQPRRFNELTRLLPGRTQRMLTNQLRELERYGLIHREVFPVVPVNVVYLLTALALRLIPVMLAIKALSGF